MNKTHVLPVCVYFAIFYMFENGAELDMITLMRHEIMM